MCSEVAVGEAGASWVFGMDWVCGCGRAGRSRSLGFCHPERGGREGWEGSFRVWESGSWPCSLHLRPSRRLQSILEFEGQSLNLDTLSLCLKPPEIKRRCGPRLLLLQVGTVHAGGAGASTLPASHAGQARLGGILICSRRHTQVLPKLSSSIIHEIDSILGNKPYSKKDYRS